MPTEEEKVTRKLRAILSADVKGYSLLMSDDEAYTVRKLEEYRTRMSNLIKANSGRVVDAVGDNLLAEFSSSVDAVQCAVEIQKALKAKNSDLAEDKRLNFRIGVNVGDVIQDKDRIFGAGVNVAARIEGLADPGGICISRNAYDHIKDKLKLGYEYLGEHRVKNIKDPVRVYKVLMADEDAGKLIGDVPKPVTKNWIWATIVVAAMVIAVVATLVYQKMAKPEFEPAKVEKMAYPLPEKPSVAVLPFNNLSDNPAQNYIAVGITENIISALSNISGMFVIASDSTSTYKGKHVKIHQVSEELGVRYVLEGSVQKSRDRVRVNAQLIDATSGHYLWSEKYDSELQDLFGLQDEITYKIIVELQVQLTEGEQARVSHKKTTNLEAWSYANKGLAIWMRTSKENNAKAMELFKQAVELDPNYVWAWVRLAWTHSMAALHPGWSQHPSEHLKMFHAISKKVLAMDESDSDANALSGLAYLWEREHEKAIAAGEKSIVLGPTNAQAHVLLACSMTEVGRFDDVIRLVGRAMRLHPYYPAYYLTWIGSAYRMTGRYEEALTVYNQLLKRSRKGEYPDIDAHVYLADLFAEMGKTDEARAHAAEIFKIEPAFSLKRVRSINTYDYTDPALLERRLKALRKAGIPDKPPLSLPDKPSIAVLPFDNLSDNPEQGYLADGLTDELIGDLAKVKDIFVISRNSAFTYKGKDIKIPEVAKELNVRYVLEGSVQRAGNRLRIRAQLIDGKTDHHMWSESYDGVMDDIFKLQDEITGKIVAALAVKLSEDEKSGVTIKGTDNLNAYEEYLRGLTQFRRWTPDSFSVAIHHFRKAIQIDSNYSDAYSMLGYIYNYATMFGGKKYYKAIGKDHFAARVLARYYLELGLKKPNFRTYSGLALMELMMRRFESARKYANQAVLLAPNDTDALRDMGQVLLMSGDPKAMEYFKKSSEADPLNPVSAGIAFFLAKDGQYQEALKWTEKSLSDNPYLRWCSAFSAISYANLGNYAEASDAISLFCSGYPTTNECRNVQLHYNSWPFKNNSGFDWLIEGLAKAGLKFLGGTKNYYRVEPSNVLSGEEIESLLFGKDLIIPRGWITVSMHLEVNGKVEKQYLRGDKKFNGLAWIDGDSICEQYEKQFEGIAFCSDIYRNPDGSKLRSNEYLRVSDLRIDTFSVKN